MSKFKRLGTHLEFEPPPCALPAPCLQQSHEDFLPFYTMSGKWISFYELYILFTLLNNYRLFLSLTLKRQSCVYWEKKRKNSMKICITSPSNPPMFKHIIPN